VGELVGDGLAVGVGVGVIEAVVVAVGVEDAVGLTLGDAVYVPVGEAVAEGLGMAVLVAEGVEVGGVPASPGLGDACATQSAAASVSCAAGTRASDWPAETVLQAGLSSFVSLP
jgi:hypothetical protein